MDYAQVTTHAEVTDPYGGTKKTTNVFHFTYHVPQIIRKVYPSTYHGICFVDFFIFKFHINSIL